MGPVPSASTCDIEDGLLAVAGYRVGSSDLCHVADRLEHLDSANITFGHDAIYYNPSDLTTWVDPLGSASDPGFSPSPWTDHSTVTAMTMTNSLIPQVHSTSSEDSAILLVHLLMTCAGHVERGETVLAADAIKEMKVQLLTSVGTGFGIGKVAGYFLDALHRRLFSVPPPATTAVEDEFLYYHFYESSPYLKFAHFTANQAILEAFDGADRVHVVDLGLMHGLQWPALIQAFALRPGGPPSVRLTGVGPPSPDGRDSLRETGVKLAELARTVGVRFSFMGIAANRLEDVKPWMLNVSAGEAVAVNSIFQLHKLIREPDKPGAAVDSMLAWIAGLKPRIVTVVEQEADHNKQPFVDRFAEALFYYSAMFDSLEGAGLGGARESAAVAEIYLQREICNIICCEGLERIERHEPLGKWRGRLGQAAGLRPVHLGSNAFKQASMLLTLFSGEGYCVEELDGCLKLGWHSRPMISASAWRGDDVDGLMMMFGADDNVGLDSSTASSRNGNGNGNGNGMAWGKKITAVEVGCRV